MNFEMYQAVADSTAVYPREYGIEYTIIGLVGEVGELTNKFKKVIRGDVELTDEVVSAISDEIGDALWYLAQLCTELGIELSAVADRNLDKLADRQNRGVIKGSGDTR